jgi:small subunit ribosomal protein S6
MTSYESIFIAAPSLSPDAQDALVTSYEELIKEQGGTVTNTIKWGRRNLAYEIKGFKEGVYTIFEMEGNGDLVKELERRFRLNDSVIKFMTIKTERKKKLQRKGAKARQAKADARSKRSSKPASADSRGRNDRFRGDSRESREG